MSIRRLSVWDEQDSLGYWAARLSENWAYYVDFVNIISMDLRKKREKKEYTLLPIGSEEREVLGVGSIPVAILPSCSGFKFLCPVREVIFWIEKDIHEDNKQWVIKEEALKSLRRWELFLKRCQRP